MKKASAIIVSDIHLREDRPICRTDYFWGAQWRKLEFIKNLQKKHECIVLHAGDLFHHWKPSPFLLSQAIEYIPYKFYSIYGQHDLPQHSLELAYKSGLYALATAGKVILLGGANFGETPDFNKHAMEFGIGVGKPNRKVLVWHKLVWKGKKPWFDCTEPNAMKILRTYPEYDLIVTGDNHKTFVEEYKGRLLINPGSMMRQKADQIDHKPCVFLWFAKHNYAEQVFLPITKDVITNEHINKIVERDERIQAFVERLTDEFDTDINFQDNLKQFIAQNNIRKEVVDYINKSLDRE